MTYLDSLRPGQPATIVELDGDDAGTRRLMELGLLPGEPVKLIGRAPLGDPIAILIRGTRIAVRVSDARRIRIESSTPH
jgi:ferrous iron transport protein A